MTEQEKNKKNVKRLIRKGLIPRRFFVCDKDGHLERDKKGHLTWRTKDTLTEMTKEEK